MLTDYLSEEYCRAYIKAFDKGAVSDQTLYNNCKAFMTQLKETQLFPMGYNGHTTDSETVEEPCNTITQELETKNSSPIMVGLNL